MARGVDTISMTWPQYLRRQCLVYESLIVRLGPRLCDALLLLLMRRGQIISTEEFIAFLYPDPDDEPERAEMAVLQTLFKLRRALPGIVEHYHGRGYMVAQ